MADINTGDLVYLKAGSIRHNSKDCIGWVIGSQYSELWWEVEWADGGVSTESAQNIREYKKEAYKRMKRVVDSRRKR
jgi:hypothetical protein